MFAAAPSVEIEFSWEKNFHQTYDPFAEAVDWYRTASVPRQTVVLLPAVLTGQYRALVSYPVQVKSETGLTTETETRTLELGFSSEESAQFQQGKLGSLGISWIRSYVLQYDYITIIETPCKAGGGIYREPHDFCGRTLEFTWEDNLSPGYPGFPKVPVLAEQLSVLCVDSGQTVLSKQRTELTNMGALNVRARNAVVSPSADCSRNSGYIPTQSPGIRGFSYSWADPYPGVSLTYGRGGYGNESLTVYSAFAVFGDQRVNLLSTSIETNWEQVAAQYRLGTGLWADL